MDRTISSSDLKSKINNSSVTILDVRRKADYDADSVVIPGAEWHDPDSADAWSSVLPKHQEIVI